MKRIALGLAAVVMASVITTQPVDAGFERDDIKIVVDDDVMPGAPNMVFNPERQEYFAAYLATGGAVVGHRLDADGNPLGALIEIGERGVDTFNGPAVAYNAATNQYAVGWSNFVDGSPDIEAFGRLVSDQGVVVGEPVRLHAPKSDCQVSGVEFAANAASGGFMATLRFLPRTAVSCFDGSPVTAFDEQPALVALDANLAFGASVAIRAPQPVANWPYDLAVNDDGTGFLVGVYDMDTDRRVSYLFESDLSPIATVEFDIPAVAGLDQYQNTFATYEPVSDRWVVMATKFAGSARIQSFDSSGTIVLPPTIIDESGEAVGIIALEALGDGTVVGVTTPDGPRSYGLIHVSATGALLGRTDVLRPSFTSVATAVDTTRDLPRVMFFGSDTSSVPLGAKSRVVDITPGGALPLTPGRILDTRTGPDATTIDGEFLGDGIRPAGDVVMLDVAGRGGVPSNAEAVFLNIAAAGSPANGFITAYPCDAAERPTTSNLNYVGGQAASAAAIAKLDADGRVCLFTSSTAHLIVDVNGFVPAGGTVESLVPARLLETRAGLATIDGTSAGIGRVAAGSTTMLTVTDRGGVPADAEAVLVNVTAITPSASTFLTVFPCGETQPTAASLNSPQGGVVNNLVLAKVGTSGQICIFSSSATDLVVDASAYVPAGGGLSSIVPARLWETRIGPGNTTIDGLRQGTGRIGVGTVQVQVTGRGGVPDIATGAMLNVAAINPTTGGFITLWPCGQPTPTAANVNFGPGSVVSNAVFVKIGDNGRVCFSSTSNTDLAIDVVGYVLA